MEINDDSYNYLAIKEFYKIYLHDFQQKNVSVIPSRNYCIETIRVIAAGIEYWSSNKQNKNSGKKQMFLKQRAAAGGEKENFQENDQLISVPDKIKKSSEQKHLKKNKKKLKKSKSRVRSKVKKEISSKKQNDSTLNGSKKKNNNKGKKKKHKKHIHKKHKKSVEGIKNMAFNNYPDKEVPKSEKSFVKDAEYGKSNKLEKNVIDNSSKNPQMISDSSKKNNENNVMKIENINSKVMEQELKKGTENTEKKTKDDKKEIPMQNIIPLRTKKHHSKESKKKYSKGKDTKKKKHDKKRIDQGPSADDQMISGKSDRKDRKKRKSGSSENIKDHSAGKSSSKKMKQIGKTDNLEGKSYSKKRKQQKKETEKTKYSKKEKHNPEGKSSRRKKQGKKDRSPGKSPSSKMEQTGKGDKIEGKSPSSKMEKTGKGDKIEGKSHSKKKKQQKKESEKTKSSTSKKEKHHPEGKSPRREKQGKIDGSTGKSPSSKMEQTGKGDKIERKSHSKKKKQRTKESEKTKSSTSKKEKHHTEGKSSSKEEKKKRKHRSPGKSLSSKMEQKRKTENLEGKSHSKKKQQKKDSEKTKSSTAKKEKQRKKHHPEGGSSSRGQKQRKKDHSEKNSSSSKTEKERKIEFSEGKSSKKKIKHEVSSPKSYSIAKNKSDRKNEPTESLKKYSTSDNLAETLLTAVKNGENDFSSKNVPISNEPKPGDMSSRKMKNEKIYSKKEKNKNDNKLENRKANEENERKKLQKMRRVLHKTINAEESSENTGIHEDPSKREWTTDETKVMVNNISATAGPIDRVPENLLSEEKIGGMIPTENGKLIKTNESSSSRKSYSEIPSVEETKEVPLVRALSSWGETSEMSSKLSKKRNKKINKKSPIKKKKKTNKKQTNYYHKKSKKNEENKESSLTGSFSRSKVERPETPKAEETMEDITERGQKEMDGDETKQYDNNSKNKTVCHSIPIAKEIKNPEKFCSRTRYEIAEMKLVKPTPNLENLIKNKNIQENNKGSSEPTRDLTSTEGKNDLTYNKKSIQIPIRDSVSSIPINVSVFETNQVRGDLSSEIEKKVKKSEVEIQSVQTVNQLGNNKKIFGHINPNNGETTRNNDRNAITNKAIVIRNIHKITEKNEDSNKTEKTQNSEQEITKTFIKEIPEEVFPSMDNTQDENSSKIVITKIPALIQPKIVKDSTIKVQSKPIESQKIKEGFVESKTESNSTEITDITQESTNDSSPKKLLDIPGLITETVPIETFTILKEILPKTAVPLKVTPYVPSSLTVSTPTQPSITVKNDEEILQKIIKIPDETKKNHISSPEIKPSTSYDQKLSKEVYSSDGNVVLPSVLPDSSLRSSKGTNLLYPATSVTEKSPIVSNQNSPVPNYSTVNEPLQRINKPPLIMPKQRFNLENEIPPANSENIGSFLGNRTGLTDKKTVLKINEIPSSKEGDLKNKTSTTMTENIKHPAVPTLEKTICNKTAPLKVKVCNSERQLQKCSPKVQDLQTDSTSTLLEPLLVTPPNIIKNINYAERKPGLNSDEELDHDPEIETSSIDKQMTDTFVRIPLSKVYKIVNKNTNEFIDKVFTTTPLHTPFIYLCLPRTSEKITSKTLNMASTSNLDVESHISSVVKNDVKSKMTSDLKSSEDLYKDPVKRTEEFYEKNERKQKTRKIKKKMRRSRRKNNHIVLPLDLYEIKKIKFLKRYGLDETAKKNIDWLLRNDTSNCEFSAEIAIRLRDAFGSIKIEDSAAYKALEKLKESGCLAQDEHIKCLEQLEKLSVRPLTISRLSDVITQLPRID